MKMEENKNENQKESEVIKALRKHYEDIIADKDKIIMDLISKPKEETKEVSKKEENEDTESDEEKRRKKRFEYYKKYIR